MAGLALLLRKAREYVYCAAFGSSGPGDSMPPRCGRWDVAIGYLNHISMFLSPKVMAHVVDVSHLFVFRSLLFLFVGSRDIPPSASTRHARPALATKHTRKTSAPLEKNSAEYIPTTTAVGTGSSC